MKSNFKKIFVYAWPLGMLAIGAPSFAKEDAFEEAFPSENKCDYASCMYTQPGLAVTETGMGLAMIAVSGDLQGDANFYRKQNYTIADPEKMLESNARKIALDELKAKNPAAVALLDEKLNLTILKARGVSPAEAESIHLTDRLAALENRRSELKVLEREVGARTSELVTAVKKGHAVPAALNDAAHVYSRLKPGNAVHVAAGLALVIDGGLRGLALVNGNRSPGISPAVTMGAVTAKKFLSADKPAANEGADTSMDIK